MTGDGVEVSPPHDLVAGYALNALGEHDRERFEAHLADCADCTEDLRSLSGATAVLAFDVQPAVPPPALRGRLLEAARNERPAAKVVPLRGRFTVPAVSGLAAVAACAAIGLGIWAASLHGSLSRERDARGGREAALGVLADPGARRVPLKGADGVLAVSANGRAALALTRLAPAPEGKTYEAWVIETRAPEPAGVFGGANDAPTVVSVTRPVRRGATVAITVEPHGGVDAPTSAPIVTAQA